MNRHEVTVERTGPGRIAIHAGFLTELTREAITDACAPERRAELEEFGYAVAQLAKAIEADACISGPPEPSDELERLAGEADDRWAALDLSAVAFLDEKAARALYQALGAVLLTMAHVARHIPAVVA